MMSVCLTNLSFNKVTIDGMFEIPFRHTYKQLCWTLVAGFEFYPNHFKRMYKKRMSFREKFIDGIVMTKTFFFLKS